MKIYTLTKHTVSVNCPNYRRINFDPTNPGFDSDPERLGIYTSEADAIKALKRCTASIEWRKGWVYPFVEAEWYEVNAYTCDDAVDAEECIELGDMETIDSTACPTTINISSDHRLEWNGRGWIDCDDDDECGEDDE